MKIRPNVTLKIQGDGNSLWLRNCRLFCCDGLWNGIEVTGSNQAVVVIEGTEIEDALNAIKSDKRQGTILNLNEATFNRNVTGIYLEGEDSYTAAESPQISHMVHANFTVTSPLNQNASPLYGIRTKNVLSPFSQFQSSNDGNSFVGLLYGIYAEGSQTRLFIFNHYYTNIGRIGVYFTGGNLPQVQRSVFTNCRYGVSMFNAKDLYCYFNTFIISNSGNLDRALLRVRQPLPNHFLAVENCIFSISNQQTGHVTAYDVYTNPAVPTMMKVWSNTFNLLNPFLIADEKQSTGIKITGDLIAGSDLDIEEVNVFNINPFIQNFNVGLWLTGGMHRNGLHFVNNEFYCSGIGIWLDGSVIGEDSHVSDNRFFTVTDNFGIGMRIAAFEGLMVCANQFHPNSIRTNYEFSGQSMSSNFVLNSTQSGSFFILPDATIGQQIDRGNLWKPVFNPDNTVAYRPPVTNSNTDQDKVFASKFIVNEPQSIWNPATNTYTYLSELHPFDVNPDVFPLEDAFFDDGGGAQAVACVIQIGASSPPDFGDVAIAQGTFGAWFSQPAVGWDAEQYLYRKLNLYPSYAGAHSSFPTFLSSRANTSVGKFYNLEQKVQEAGTMPAELANQVAALQSEITALEAEIATLSPTYTPSAEYLDLLEEQRQKIEELKAVEAQFAIYAAGKLTEAWNMLPNITTSNTHEWNKKRVYEIYIGSRLFQSGTLTETQVTNLKNIGQQCVEDGGKTVLMARGLLNECDYEDIRATVEECYPPVEERSMAKQLQNAIAQQVSVTPNPVSDLLMLSAPADCILNVYAADGRLQSSRGISAGTTRLPISLQSGLYFFQFQFSDGAIVTRKVVVQ
jgi:hypothetical protein